MTYGYDLQKEPRCTRNISTMQLAMNQIILFFKFCNLCDFYITQALIQSENNILNCGQIYIKRQMSERGFNVKLTFILQQAQTLWPRAFQSQKKLELKRSINQSINRQNTFDNQEILRNAIQLNNQIYLGFGLLVRQIKQFKSTRARGNCDRYFSLFSDIFKRSKN